MTSIHNNNSIPVSSPTESELLASQILEILPRIARNDQILSNLGMELPRISTTPLGDINMLPHNIRIFATPRQVLTELELLMTLPLEDQSIKSETVTPDEIINSFPICETCSICLEVEPDQSRGPRLTLPCKHMFHCHCIKTWLNNHTTCPICRESVLPDK